MDAYRLGQQAALEKLGYVVMAVPYDPAELKGQFKSMGAGMLGGGALGAMGGALSGQPGKTLGGAALGALVGGSAGMVSKGIGNLVTNSDFDTKTDEMRKRLRDLPYTDTEGRNAIYDEHDALKAERKKKLDRLFY